MVDHWDPLYLARLRSEIAAPVGEGTCCATRWRTTGIPSTSLASALRSWRWYENALAAGTSQEDGRVAAVISFIRGGTLGHGDDELVLGVGGGGHGAARAGREAKPPLVELEGGRPLVRADIGREVPHDDLGDAGGSRQRGRVRRPGRSCPLLAPATIRA